MESITKPPSFQSNVPNPTPPTTEGNKSGKHMIMALSLLLLLIVLFFVYMLMQSSAPPAVLDQINVMPPAPAPPMPKEPETNAAAPIDLNADNTQDIESDLGKTLINESNQGFDDIDNDLRAL